MWREDRAAGRDGREVTGRDGQGVSGPRRRRAMESHITLTRALVASVPACALLAGSLVLFSREKARSSYLQVFGAGCFVVVVVAPALGFLSLEPREPELRHRC